MPFPTGNCGRGVAGAGSSGTGVGPAGTVAGAGGGAAEPVTRPPFWSAAEPLAVSWMAKVARVFREEGLDASAAHLVEAARLAETLAAMQGQQAGPVVGNVWKPGASGL